MLKMELKILDSFLENSFVLIYAITLIVAMARYPKYFDTALKYFPILILYTFLNELLGELIHRYDTFSLAFNNLYSDTYIVIYTLYNIVFFLYFYFLFRTYTENTTHRTLIKYGGVFFIATCFINPIIQDIFKEYQYLIFFSGALILISCVLMYLKEQVGVTAGKLKNNILFWIASGLLIYHIGYLPIKLHRYLNEQVGLTESPYLKYVHLLLIVTMYGSFIIGFLRMKKRLAK